MPEPISQHVVEFPGVPDTQCPHCIYATHGRTYLTWPAIELRRGRYVYGCAHGHRWFARGAA